MPRKVRSRGSKKNNQQPGRAARRRTTAPAEGPLGEGQPIRGFGSMDNAVVTIPRLPLFGLKTRRMLRYEESITLTGSANNVYGYIFSANGCYDPNITGTGHQPMGFDPLMLMYDHYTVVKSRMILNAWNTLATQPIKLGIAVISSPSDYSTNYQTNLENGQIVYATLSPAGAANSMVRLEQSVNLAAINGVQQLLDSHDMRGDSANNPAEQTYYAIEIWNPQSATVAIAYVDVIIEFDVVFTEPRADVQSLHRKDEKKQATRK